MGLAQVAHPLFAVALRAGVQCSFGIVVVCQVVRRIGAPAAELDSHVPAPKAGRLDSICWPGVGGICVLQTLFPISGEAKAIEMNASIVRRYAPDIETVRKAIPRFVVPAFVPDPATATAG